MHFENWQIEPLPQMLSVAVLKLILAQKRNLFAQSCGVAQLLHGFLPSSGFVYRRWIEKKNCKPFGANRGSRRTKQLKQRSLPKNVQVCLIEMLITRVVPASAPLATPVVFQTFNPPLIKARPARQLNRTFSGTEKILRCPNRSDQRDRHCNVNCFWAVNPNNQQSSAQDHSRDNSSQRSTLARA